ncbi:MAG TPA: 2-hydroxyacid dehydrogenase [Methylomirabilota bacterium]|nr:2-hydroxyacid dehydrogenase [Methylomirabilota bacterium]
MEVSVFDTKPYDRLFLEKAGGAGRINWHFHDFRLSEDTARIAAGAQAACIFVNDIADRPVLKQLKACGIRLVALRCAGFNNVDSEAARELCLPVVRVPSYSPHAVAEHAVALLLTLNRKIHRAYNRVREHNFSLNGLIGFDVAGKTVGIVGTGKIGKIAAQIFRGFDTKVLAHDPFPATAWAGAHGIQYVALKTLLAECDIVSLHLPLTRDSFHLINADAFATMKPGAYLINTSRGKLVDTAALVAALKENRLGGIALDVYEEEEGIFFEDFSDKTLQDDLLARLLGFSNVLITSHQAFFTQEALNEIARVTVGNILRLETAGPWLEGTAL